MGALIGGFALASLQSTDFVPDTLGRAIYMTSFLGVHGCTCAAVTTALLGRRANLLKDDEEAAAWAAAHPWLLLLPFAKFMVGCGAYLISVLLISLARPRRRWNAAGRPVHRRSLRLRDGGRTRNADLLVGDGRRRGRVP